LKPKTPISKRLADTRFLAARHGVAYEILRSLRIGWEFARGFIALRKVGSAVTVFGSARFGEGHPHYDLARRTGAALAAAGLTVITGGGPGIMEAANRGARESGGPSLGLGIALPHERGHNAYLDRHAVFSYFFVRKVMLIKYSYAFVILPGGVGTLDELTEALTLIHTGKLHDFPVILMGREYWRGFNDWLADVLVEKGAVSAENLANLHVTDDPAEAARIILAALAHTDLRIESRKSLAD
jgi:uncharacterized protein (TIGR00730 family)